MQSLQTTIFHQPFHPFPSPYRESFLRTLALAQSRILQAHTAELKTNLLQSYIHITDPCHAEKTLLVAQELFRRIPRRHREKSNSEHLLTNVCSNIELYCNALNTDSSSWPRFVEEVKRKRPDLLLQIEKASFQHQHPESSFETLTDQERHILEKELSHIESMPSTVELASILATTTGPYESYTFVLETIARHLYQQEPLRRLKQKCEQLGLLTGTDATKINEQGKAFVEQLVEELIHFCLQHQRLDVLETILKDPAFTPPKKPFSDPSLAVSIEVKPSKTSFFNFKKTYKTLKKSLGISSKKKILPIIEPAPAASTSSLPQLDLQLRSLCSQILDSSDLDKIQKLASLAVAKLCSLSKEKQNIERLEILLPEIQEEQGKHFAWIENLRPQELKQIKTFLSSCAASGILSELTSRDMKAILKGFASSPHVIEHAVFRKIYEQSKDLSSISLDELFLSLIHQSQIDPYDFVHLCAEIPCARKALFASLGPSDPITLALQKIRQGRIETAVSKQMQITFPHGLHVLKSDLNKNSSELLSIVILNERNKPSRWPFLKFYLFNNGWKKKKPYQELCEAVKSLRASYIGKNNETKMLLDEITDLVDRNAPFRELQAAYETIQEAFLENEDLRSLILKNKEPFLALFSDKFVERISKQKDVWNEYLKTCPST